MHLNTVCVGAHVTPSVIGTWFSHYLERKSRRHKPTAHVSYDEGLNVVRSFLSHAAYHTVEDAQAFTSRKIPTPHWVKIQEEIIPAEYLSEAAVAITEQLGDRDLLRVGGKEWWQWRTGPEKDLRAEWIEMKSDYHARKQVNTQSKRVMLYVHGGAYYFGSVDTHRYQMQRHARKLKARVFAPSYRLSPQFPFPCGLQDCLAAYLYLLKIHDPTEIILTGDSAGGGMIVSMLVILRDRRLPLPAGAILISPWVDLTHSFPSVAAGSPLDYIPEHGFMHRPSGAWPPPNVDDLIAIRKVAEGGTADANGANVKASDSGATDHHHHHHHHRDLETAIQGYTVRQEAAAEVQEMSQQAYPGLQGDQGPVNSHRILANEADNLAVPMLDGTVVEIKDQIQMYAPNQLLSHPLVSPVLQPSLGGLPPLLILTGGGEMLRDEQIYLAHKAADPSAYPPNDSYLDEHDPERKILHKYAPTYVQLQVWDDLCHVAPTLSWTRPAKFMYRSIAQFGAWALAHAQHDEIDIPEDNASSTSSTPSSNSSTTDLGRHEEHISAPSSVGRAGDPLPAFHKHMIRQRVDRHGITYLLDPPSALPALQQSREQVGAINPDIVKKWLNAKKKWDKKFAKEKLRVQQRRIRDFERGYYGFDGESPPACALASRRQEKDIAPTRRVRKSYAMMLWTLIASKHDKDIIQGQAKAEEVPHTRKIGVDGPNDDITEKTSEPRGESLFQKQERERALSPQPDQRRERTPSQTRIVSDIGQTDGAENGIHQPAGDGESDVRPRVGSRFGSGSSDYGIPTILIAGVDFDSDSRPSSRIGNASTTAVLNADGVILPAGSKNGRPGLETRSNSGATSVMADHAISSNQSASTLIDSGPHTPTAKVTETGLAAVSSASTMAVHHSPGVLRESRQENQLPNTIEEALSAKGHVSDAAKHAPTAITTREDAEEDDLITPKATAQDSKGAFPFHSAEKRPGMPQRDEFITAEEYHAVEQKN